MSGEAVVFNDLVGRSVLFSVSEGLIRLVYDDIFNRLWTKS